MKPYSPYSEAETVKAFYNGAARGDFAGASEALDLGIEPTRVLLADDEIDLWWDQCLAALARSSYDVDTAEDGEAAWEALQTYHYDLLITDNKMPKVSGLELITNLRAQGMTLPIIFASSLLPRITPEQKAYFLNVHLLEKPVAPSQLLETIDHVALMPAMA